MSAGTGVWRDVLLRAARTTRKVAVAAPASVLKSAAPPPILSLVRQVFFPAAGIRRSRVLFAAADAETKVLEVCEQVGQALAEMSGATVAIMDASPPSDTPFDLKRRSGKSSGDWWRSYSSQIAEKVWRVPSALMSKQPYPASPDRRIFAETGDLPFDYVLFASVVADSETPAFCSLCDGAVLVLAANQTRRESALRAKETLLQCNAELLGTVLDGRMFSIPEAIYRRL